MGGTRNKTGKSRDTGKKENERRAKYRERKEEGGERGGKSESETR